MTVASSLFSTPETSPVRFKQITNWIKEEIYVGPLNQQEICQYQSICIPHHIITRSLEAKALMQPGERMTPGPIMGWKQAGGGSVIFWGNILVENVWPCHPSGCYQNTIAVHVQPFMETIFPYGHCPSQQDMLTDSKLKWFRNVWGAQQWVWAVELASNLSRSPSNQPSVESPPHNLQGSKDLLLTCWCQISQHTVQHPWLRPALQVRGTNKILGR